MFKLFMDVSNINFGQFSWIKDTHEDFVTLQDFPYFVCAILNVHQCSYGNTMRAIMNMIIIDGVVLIIVDHSELY